MRKLFSVLLALSLVVVVSGCGKDKGVKKDGADGGAVVEGVDAGQGAQGDMFGAAGDLLIKKIVYFEFDSSTITAESRQIIEAHARKLASGGGKVVLEGHADERGTREYNLALGEARANAVKSVMSALGVAPTTVQTISYGEERPVALEHDESAWHLNRRVEIIY